MVPPSAPPGLLAARLVVSMQRTGAVHREGWARGEEREALKVHNFRTHLLLGL